MLFWSHDSLEEQTMQGNFVPHGRDDILNIAIGQPDHPVVYMSRGQV